MSVTIEDHLGNFPLEIDWTGDGQVDSLAYPEGTSDVPESQTPPGVGSVINHAEVRPNPSTGSVVLSFDVVGVVHGARVDIWDVAGRRVRSIAVGEVMPGAREVAWDGTGDDGKRPGAGAYFYQVSHEGGRSGPRKVILLR
jgi:hypothetical protein